MGAKLISWLQSFEAPPLTSHQAQARTGSTASRFAPPIETQLQRAATAKFNGSVCIHVVTRGDYTAPPVSGQRMTEGSAMEDVPGILWYLLAVGFVVSGVLMSAWFGLLAHRHRVRTLEVLKSYAERGEEPPAAVLAAMVTSFSAPQAHSQPAAPMSRRSHLDHFILNACLAVAAAGVAWWRISDGGGPQWLAIAAVIFAAFLGAAAVAGMIALASRSGRNE